MLKLLVCLCVLISATSADYDFQDSDFNELLFEDLTIDVDDDLSEPLRFKRDIEAENEPKECQGKKGKKEKDTHCCNNGEKTNSQESGAGQLKKIQKTCIAEIRGESVDEASYDPLSCDGVQTMRRQMVCAAECMAKKLDILMENGDMKREALLNYTAKCVGDNKWKASVSEEYVDKCLNELKASKELKSSDESSIADCNPYPLEFHHCIWKQFVEGCPAEMQIDSKKCKKIRERLAKGDTSYADKSLKKRLRPRKSEKHID